MRVNNMEQRNQIQEIRRGKGDKKRKGKGNRKTEPSKKSEVRV